MPPFPRLLAGPLLTLVAVGAGGWVLYRLRGLLGLLLAVFLAYLLDPAVTALSRWGLRRGAAALLLGLALGTATVLALVLIVPALALVALLAGGTLFGFWGILLGVPGAAVLKVLGREGLRAWQAAAAGGGEGGEG